MAGCTRQPAEQILPYVRQPENVVPGRPLYYATAMTLGGRAMGLLVESHEGRPTKIEGNPSHPASLGATDVFAQAALLDLYDPDRMRTLTNMGEIFPWSAFIGAMRTASTLQLASKGAGLRILTETVSSPTLAAQIEEILARFPAATWHQWDPGSEMNEAAGLRMAAGHDVSVPIQRRARLGDRRAGRRFARLRRRSPPLLARVRAAPPTRRAGLPSVRGGVDADDDGRESRPSTADEAERHRDARARTGRRPGCRGCGLAVPRSLPSDSRGSLPFANDLTAHRGSSLVVAGERQPPVVHALRARDQRCARQQGQTVLYTDSVEAHPVDQVQSIRDLAGAMAADRSTRSSSSAAIPCTRHRRICSLPTR
jgi:molybdopterin-containing oxidoreductase family iron-sulfur binding subunit